MGNHIDKDALYFKNGRAKKSLCLCLSKEKRAELKRLYGRDIIQCAGNSCPYYSVGCGRANLERFKEERRNKARFRLEEREIK